MSGEPGLDASTPGNSRLITTKPDSSQRTAEMAVDLFDNWLDPIEAAVRAPARKFIEELSRGELDTVLARPRYRRSQKAGDEGSADVTGHRNGSRNAVADRHVRPDRDRRAARQAEHYRRQDNGWKSRALRTYPSKSLSAFSHLRGAHEVAALKIYEHSDKRSRAYHEG